MRTKQAIPASKPLKTQNIPRVWGVVTADALTLIGLSYPVHVDRISLSIATAVRLSSAAIAPVVVLLLTSIVPASVKDTFVFWRVRNAMPGHRAFSLHARRDSRIDLKRLRENIGRFPQDPREQNTLWYRLYRKVETDPMIIFSHRNYLLFRDIAALSAVLVVVTPIILLVLRAALPAIWISSCLFVIQYLATSLAARNHGNRLVANVLALHSLKRY
jgi:hypothetical protein